MEKKIIAVVCALIIVITMFVSCSKAKGPKIQLDNGEFYLATDAQGNTMVNDDGDLIVYVQDENGEFLTDENHERKTNIADFPDNLVSDDKYETQDFVFTLPKGYTVSEDGKIMAKGATKSYLTIKNYGKMNTIEYLAELEKNIQIANTFYEEAKKQNPNTTLDIFNKEITSGKIKADVIDFKTIQGENHYISVNVYFLYEEELYSVFYNCSDDTYDPAFDVVQFVTDNLTWK